MQNDMPRVTNFAVTAAMFEGGLAVFALSLGWAFDISPMASFHWSWIDLAWGVVATVPPLLLLGVCRYLPWEPFRRIIRLLDQTILPLFRECRLFEIAVIALLAGLGEEMLFRPIVQDGLAHRMGTAYGPALGLAAAAIIFGLLHAMTFAYGILAGVIGSLLGRDLASHRQLARADHGSRVVRLLALVILLKAGKTQPTDQNTQ